MIHGKNFFGFIIVISILLLLYLRVKSRCVEVYFKRPKVGPVNADERSRRRDFEIAMSSGYYTSALPWIVSLDKSLDQNGQNEIEEILSEIQQWPKFDDQQRLCQGWAILLYFTFQV